jgi:hypothetical protein
VERLNASGWERPLPLRGVGRGGGAYSSAIVKPRVPKIRFTYVWVSL